MTVNEFIKSMAKEGFTGNFVATNNEHTYKGTIHEGGKVSVIKVQTTEESRQKIKEMFNKK